MLTRISSQDLGYVTGQLSLYPQAKDTRYQLYTATNNSETTLSQSLTYNGKYLVVTDNTNFPANGIIRVGRPPSGQSGPAEMIYYDTKTAGTFKNLIRGFAGSRQNPWPIGSSVTNAVFAEYHNAAKDAIIQIETNLGTATAAEAVSLNGILSAQETKFLAPRPIFRAYPISGAPPLKVRFQNFSVGPFIKYLWDFGDGSTSTDKSPVHIFQNEGIYTVQLNIITSLGAQGITTKSNYINVNQKNKPPFFYVSPNQGYSTQTAAKINISPTTFDFVDQTDGDIIQRYWIFDGSGTQNGEEITTESVVENNPNIHTTKYIYDSPGEYQPSILIMFDDQSLTRASIADPIIVL